MLSIFKTINQTSNTGAEAMLTYTNTSDGYPQIYGFFANENEALKAVQDAMENHTLELLPLDDERFAFLNGKNVVYINKGDGHYIRYEVRLENCGAAVCTLFS